MASYIEVELDTTAPSNPRIEIEQDNVYTTTQDVVAYLFTDDVDRTGYEMKIYGDVDPTFDPDIQDTATASTWISFAETKNIRLSVGDGVKTLRYLIRDSVYNATTEVNDTIELNTTQPSVSVTNQDRDIISLQEGKRIVNFNFTVTNMDFVEYEVRAVTTVGATHTSGFVIPTTEGSVNTSGVGTYPINTTISVSITGNDLKAVDSGDGDKIIKVFARDAAGNWSS